MNKDLATVITGLVTDENKNYFFVQKNGITYRLSKEEALDDLKIGDTVNGFVYETMDKTLALTTVIPAARIGRYGWGTVVSVRKDLGVFVDIGLKDKEVVVSLDLLPAEKHLWPKKGDRLMITLSVDDKDRIWGQLADESIFRSIAKLPTEEWKNKDVTGTVYRLKLSGTFLLTDEYYIGFIHPEERDVEPRLGEVVNGRVVGISSHGMLNVSLKPRAYQALDDDAAMIRALLEKAPENRLPYHDKSDPEAIRQFFGISKAQFKRALGRLMKAGLIIQNDGEIRLKK